MEHFSIVLAVCRAAMQTPNPAIENHLRRLAKALEKDGQGAQAQGLAKLLQAPGKSVEIQPSRVVLSLASMGGELLTPSVKAPVDRETSAPLAEIIFPDFVRPVVPIFDTGLSGSVDGLLDEWRNIDRLKVAGVKPALSLMMFGAPGTGKTLLAHHMAKELGYPLVVARLDGLVSSFLGTTARNISNLFTFANRYKCILLLDEFDAVAKLRDDPNELGELKRVVNTLLQCLDERSSIGFTVAITNHESLLDPAVWRRFDIRIEVPKPNWDARVQILKSQFSGGMKISAVQLLFLAWVSKGYSGSDIEKLSDFVKRRFAILADKYEFIESVRKYVQLSAQVLESENRDLVIGRSEDLAYALAHDAEITMPQDKLAELFSRTQSTISRWVRKEKTQGGVRNGK
ncbi:AAA family ATPase [Pseudomonas syringae group sp. J248-6]|uniref:AAA family ATPase n=1 Tax=Pseudomonas syringae group sp. J248-6 TaxID=3079590 RepID=UPI002910242D|nr:AAA family ATPase [Pseudomonas syringae group sp. J248-6]MDU8544590.1 AAA family ATPase [Pseudomonas syringae group sp. J248-6]